uniref:Uncharacterized protein n=1 Tax=Triticum urartu TaxID=4572 RepID=A0A8R7QNH3_TRIUA
MRAEISATAGGVLLLARATSGRVGDNPSHHVSRSRYAPATPFPPHRSF